MKIISLSSYYAGPACAIADYIKKYFYNNDKQIDFFDYLVVSMKSINEILTNKEIDLDLDSAILNELNTVTIQFKNFDLLISNHDLKEFPVTLENMNDVIQKYKRRYNRLISDIKSENIIYFLRFFDKELDDTEENEILIFNKNLSVINSSLIFYLIILTDNDNLKLSNKLSYYDNIILFNFNIYNDKNKIYNDNKYFRIIDEYDYINLKTLINN